MMLCMYCEDWNFGSGALKPHLACENWLSSFDYFEGDVVTCWLANPARNYQNMELLEPFVYVAPEGRR